MCGGAPERKSSTFPAISVHFRPSRHPDFCPLLVYFKSSRSLYLSVEESSILHGHFVYSSEVPWMVSGRTHRGCRQSDKVVLVLRHCSCAVVSVAMVTTKLLIQRIAVGSIWKTNHVWR